MKKILFILFALLSLRVSAQTTEPLKLTFIEVTAPSAIKGWYPISGIADSLSSAYYFQQYSQQWGCKDVSKSGVSAKIVLTRDTLGVSPFSNAAELKGNIALVYRGGASFAQKMKYAQDAGAIAIIMINNKDQVVIAQGGIDPSTNINGMDIKIPFVVVSQEIGAKLYAQIKAGETIQASFGVKVKVAKDLAIDKNLVIAPTKRTRPKFLSYEGEISDSLGMAVYNDGLDTMNAFIAKVKVIHKDVVIHRDSFPFSDKKIAPNDTLWFMFKTPFVNKKDLDTGRYYVEYTIGDLTPLKEDASILKDTLIDQYTTNNKVTMYFSVTDSLYGISGIRNHTLDNKSYKNVPIFTGPTRPTGSFTEWGTCSVIKEENSGRMVLNGINFVPVVLPTSSSTLKGELFTVKFFEWGDAFLARTDSTFGFKGLVQSDVLEVTVEEDVKTAYKYASFSTPIQLENEKRYLVCVNTKNPELLFGYDHESVAIGPLKKRGFKSNGSDQYYFGSYYPQPLVVNYVNDNAEAPYNEFGFGLDWIPSITFKVSQSKLAVNELSTSNVNLNVYPNPADQYLNIDFKLTDNESKVDLVVKDITGKVVYSNLYQTQVGSNKIVLDLDGFVNGMYILSIETKAGVSVRKFNVENN
jgi:hypothetical protein